MDDRYPFFRFYSPLWQHMCGQLRAFCLAQIQSRFTIAGLIEQMSVSFIEPMKALPVDKLPDGDWLFEIKHDGYRALAFKDGNRMVTMCAWSRGTTRRSITHDCLIP